MKKLSDLLSKIIYQKVYIPYSNVNGRVEQFFKENINHKENNLFCY